MNFGSDAHIMGSLIGFALFIYLSIYFCFLGPHPWHMEVPRLGVQSELQLPTYTAATATRDLSCIFNLRHSSWQCQILNSLSKARDRTRNLVGFVSATPRQELQWLCFKKEEKKNLKVKEEFGLSLNHLRINSSFISKE